MATADSSSDGLLSRRQQLQALKERLEGIASLSVNKLCADCPESSPTWASILRAPVEGGQRFGVLCCYRCSFYHFKLGKGLCQVRSINMVEECKFPLRCTVN